MEKTGMGWEPAKEGFGEGGEVALQTGVWWKVF